MKYLLKSLIVCFVFSSCSPSYNISSYKHDSTQNIDSTYTTSLKAEAVIASYRGMLDKKMNRKIGEAETDITSKYGKERGENALGNLAADMIQERSNYYFDNSIDMSIQNFGGLRVNINKGDIYVRTIYELMPFDNLVTIMHLKGSTTKKLFEYLGKTKRIAISNTELKFDKEGNLLEALINGEKFDINKTYKVSTSDYLANGGGNMTFFSEAIERIDSEYLLRDIMIEYIENTTKTEKPITAKIEGRVIIED